MLQPNSLQMETSYLDSRNSDRILTVAEWKARALCDVTQCQSNVDIAYHMVRSGFKGRERKHEYKPSGHLTK